MSNEAVLKVLDTIQEHGDSILVRYRDKNVTLYELPTPVALGYVVEWIRRRISVGEEE